MSGAVAIALITQHFSFHANPESRNLAEMDVELVPPHPNLVGVADGENFGYLTT